MTSRLILGIACSVVVLLAPIALSAGPTAGASPVTYVVPMSGAQVVPPAQNGFAAFAQIVSVSRGVQRGDRGEPKAANTVSHRIGGLAAFGQRHGRSAIISPTDDGRPV
jgi:hypothetical protein